MERELRSRAVIRIPGFTELLLIVLEYLWAVVVVLNGNSVYHASAVKDYRLLELCLILTVTLLLLNWFIGRIRVTARDTIVAVAMMIYGVVYISARQASMSVVDFALLFCCSLPSLYLLFIGLQKRGLLLGLIRKIVDVVFVLALISLFFWVFGTLLQIIRPNMATYINWGYAKRVMGYHGVHFQVQLDTTFFKDQYVHRNSGIFAEAPMFNLWLDIAIAIELFLKRRPSKLRVAVLAVTVVTTISVTGLLFLALCLVLWVVQGYREQSAFHKRMIIATMLLMLIPLLVVIVSYSLVMKSDTRSYDMRLSDYTAGLQLWWDYPIFGGGYANLRALQQYSYAPNGVLGFSNSVAAVLGTGGLWITLLFYIPHFGILSNRWSGSKKISCFGLCYLFLFCTTAFFGRFVAVMMIAFEIVLLQYPQVQDRQS